MERCVCIHGHFYQPPRENPWLEEVELQDSAHPYHDWNARIASECYAPNTASRIVDDENRILDLINNYSKISFNIGPTLCLWMERHRPDVLEAIVAADRLSRERFSGHGSAIAQVYNHMIMPLATDRDQYTQAYWGILDFERRFGRFPEGMWLPETAVDTRTLETLADLGIKFTILAQRQAWRVRPQDGDAEWQEVGEGIDPRMPYTAHLPSGKTITLFFYDGPISQDMAFGGLLNNGEAFAHRLLAGFTDGHPTRQLVHVATDGESYGHHHRHGEMALSYCLHMIEQSGIARLTNYGEYLAGSPPTHDVEIHENSSWSCIHGVERWRDDCGCNSGRPGWTQGWRRPLRNALDHVRDELASRFTTATGEYLADPWKARNDFYEVAHDRSRVAVDRFLSRNALRPLAEDEVVRVLKLLELQRNTMLMYTSCGWFFDEISGIETIQILQYAAKALQLAEDVFQESFEPAFVTSLALAPSNVLEHGAAAYTLHARPAMLDLSRIAVHFAIASLFRDDPQLRSNVYCYVVDDLHHRRDRAGRFALATGKVRVESTVTLESGLYSYAVLHFGDHNVNGGVRLYQDDERFAAMQDEIRAEFERGHMTEILQLMLKHFGINNYSVWHLFRDEQRAVMTSVLKKGVDDLDSAFRQVYHDNYAAISFMHSLRHQIPEQLRSALVSVARRQVMDVLTDDDPSIDRLKEVLEFVRKWGFDLRSGEMHYASSACVNRQVARMEAGGRDLKLLEKIQTLLTLLVELRCDLNIWQAQNSFFSTVLATLGPEQERARGGDTQAAEWVRLVGEIGRLLQVKVN